MSENSKLMVSKDVANAILTSDASRTRSESVIARQLLDHELSGYANGGSMKQIVSVTVQVEVDSDHPSPVVVQELGKKMLEDALRGRPGFWISSWEWLRKT
jgi:hypothetical protein